MRLERETKRQKGREHPSVLITHLSHQRILGEKQRMGTVICEQGELGVMPPVELLKQISLGRFSGQLP